MKMTQWIQDAIRAAAEYIKGDKTSSIQLERLRPKKNPKPRKKAKKLKKAA